MTTKRLPLYTLFLTTLVSVTGDAMAAIAIPWFVLETTGSTVQMGITAFFSVAPIVIGMAFGGTLVDRLGYKRVSVVADFASGLTILLIPILHTTIGLEFWQLLLLVFLGNLMDAPGRSARRSMLPELAEHAGMSQERATGLIESMQRATTMIGGPLAGVLIVAVGASGVLAIDALTFGISAVGMLLFIPGKLVNQNIETSENSYWQDLREGYRFVRRDSLILSLILTVMITNMIDYAWSSVAYPVYMRSLFGTEEGAVLFGMLVGVFGFSALISGLLFSWLGNRISNQQRLLAIVFTALAIRFPILALFPPIGILVLTSVLGGCLAGPLNPILSTVMYRRIPDTMRGRVFGILSAGVLVAMPIGGVMGGFLLEWLNMQTTLLIYAVIYFVTTATLFFNPYIKSVNGQQTATQGQD